MRNKVFRWAACAMAVMLPATAAGQGFRDYLDAIDLNEYSLGLNLYTSQSNYAGIDDLVIVYPAPTRFGHPLLDQDPLFVRDASIGLRKFGDSGLKWGGFAKIQTLGYGSNESETLLGMRRRSWTIQAGAMAGAKLGPVHADIFASTDIANEHNGYELELKLAWPFAGARQQFVPQIDIDYQSDNVVNHYYGVRPEEAAPGRPAYEPGSAITVSGSLDWSWRFHPSWFLSTTVAVDVLPDEIRSSPIVSGDTSWRVNIGVAYDGKTFVDPGPAGTDPESHLEIGLGAFFIDATSNMDFRDVTNSSADLEGEQGLDDSSISVPIDLVWRKGRFHRVDVSYFQLNRNSSTDLDASLVIGDTTFQAGETLVTDFDTRVLRFGYGFALFRDEQKDLSVFGGLHVTDIDYRVRGDTESISASTTAFLPVIGARFRFSVTDRLSGTANLELFELDFDQHSGQLLDFAVSGQYRFGERFSAGAGFRFYRQDIDSGEDSFLGDYRIEYRGPFVFLRMRF